VSGLTEPELRSVQYLLGRTPVEERSQIEERLFTDDAFAEELQATADDLIHAYLAGALTEDDRSRFETHFLASTAHRERLAFIRGLLSAVQRVSVSTRPRWHPWAMAAAAALLALGVVLFPARNDREEPPRQALSSPEPPIVASQPHPTTPKPSIPGSGPTEIRVFRMPPTPGSPTTLTLSSNTRMVRVEVQVDEEPPSFNAIVRTGDGTEVWRAEGLVPPASGELLAFDLPARVLASDRYTLRIEGEPLRGAKVPPILEYPLRVRHDR
jgi:hypothetical protein